MTDYQTESIETEAPGIDELVPEISTEFGQLESAEAGAPEPRVHPLAASFPMMEDEDLAALAESLGSNGQIHPIVLDKSGQLLDGRNRLKACRLAGVEPQFVTTDQDPIAYILGANVNRRHLGKGQQAMAIAMAYPEATNKGGRGKTAVFDTGVSGEYVTKARFVRRHASDLVAKVMAGSSLPEAYALAVEQKREREQYEELRNDARERLDAIVTVCSRLKSDIDKPTAFLDQGDFVKQVRSDVKEIQDYVAQLEEII
jgi:hypothetical protein